ncbi:MULTISPECIES: tripartite tricarboxylate transporter substrate binding protein [unclassified Pigmentiphaga]|uniref:Bug family tripartite tricarboxylate transporter substrate binding protein n=1 Tax=unclassified Pigmentiphaga TaxID=2626614 RepID=UPI000B41C61B|nr:MULTISPECIES: tripartite tricarboxylate transporter substrate binding protein [unclassified Pigmentiphaga]OVZ66441.1 hypothetical protein CDO46_00750 [Pigmentiphaga sp. NML030171]
MRKLTLAVAIFAVLFSNMAFSQDWPNRQTVRIIVPFTAGGVTDAVGRLLADALTQRYGKTFIVENRPGAGQNVGALALAKSAPDGYTLMVTAPGPLAINQYLYPKLEYDPQAFAPITLLSSDPLVFVVNSKSKYQSLQDFLAAARANPGKLSYGSSGVGATSHMMSAVLFAKAGVQVLHIPYKGGSEAATALMGDQIDMIAIDPVAAVPQIRGGRLRPLGISAAKGTPVLPDVPSVAAAGVPGYDYATWLALIGPPGLPPELANRIASAVEDAFKSPELQSKLAAYGSSYEGGGPKQLADWIRKEQVKWKASVEASGARAGQ